MLRAIPRAGDLKTSPHLHLKGEHSQMPKSKTVDAVLAEAEQIARVWTDNPAFALSGVTLAQFQTMISELRAQQGETEDLRTRLTAALNETNTKSQAVTEIATRARTGIRGYFGPDSTQYEQAGGTRRSERKPRTRKPSTGQTP